MSYTNEVFSLISLPSPVGSTLKFWHVGRINAKNGHSFMSGGYNCWHFVAEGRGVLKTKKAEFQLSPGDIFSVRYHNEVEYGPYPGEDWTYYFLRTEGPDADELSRKIGLTPENPYIRSSHKEELLHLFSSAWQAAKENNRNAEFYAVIVYRICLLLCGSNEQAPRSPELLVKEALKIIKDPLSHNFNINELAVALHVSRMTLFNAFKNVTGQSPREHLIENQINRCKMLLLENPDLNISEITKLTAYASDKYFIRAFKRATGMSPGKFRMQQK